jgi:hypothetical protein
MAHKTLVLSLSRKYSKNVTVLCGCGVSHTTSATQYRRFCYRLQQNLNRHTKFPETKNGQQTTEMANYNTTTTEPVRYKAPPFQHVLYENTA